MKKSVFVFLLISLIAKNISAQEAEEKEVGFKVNNVFVGGSIVLGYGAGSSSYTNSGSNFVIGANPEIGYSLAQWIDAGIATNLIYNSYRFNSGGYRYRQSAINYGIGAFVRLFPIKGFFLQAQPEINWINVTQKNLDLSGSPKITAKVKANSFLAGVGYGQRFIGQSSFFTILMFDLKDDINSPYRDMYGNVLPIIRTGISIYLKDKKKKSKLVSN